MRPRPNVRRPSGVGAAVLARRLGTAAVLSALAALAAALVVGAFAFVLFWALSSLLGVAGLVATMVAARDASDDARVGLTTSVVGVVGPLVFFVFLIWLLRDAEWGW